MNLKKLGNIITPMIIILSAALTIWAGREAASAAKNSVMLCLNVMIPSLFAFTVISKLLISTNTYRIISAPFSVISRYVFRMPTDFFAVFIISQLAGYPIGAALINEMYADGKISKAQAEQLLCFCIAPGPAYVMTAAASVSSNEKMWMPILFSVIAANMLAAVITGFFREIPPKSDMKHKAEISAEIFTSSVKAGAENMTMICSMIIFFSVVLAILSKSGLLGLMTIFISDMTDTAPVAVYPLVRSFFEISSITSCISGIELVPWVAAMLSFGGICVHLQIKSICSGFSAAKAMLMRIPCAAAAFIICHSLMPRYCDVNAVAVNAVPYDQPKILLGDNEPILSIFLLIMTILIISQKSVAKTRKI